MNFSEALIKANPVCKQIRRKSWPTEYVRCIFFQEDRKDNGGMTPKIDVYLPRSSHLSILLCSEDYLATDWEVIE